MPSRNLRILLQAIDDSLANLLKPIVGACLTDAIGFWSINDRPSWPGPRLWIVMALASLVGFDWDSSLDPWLSHHRIFG